MRYNAITYPDVNNGIGLRVSLWVSGCSHHCPGCHNPETWNFESGNEFTQEKLDLLFDLVSKPEIKGLTITGGDPIDSYEDVLDLIKEFRKKFGDSKDIWLYTGYKYPEIDSKYFELFKLVDFIVEGPFIKSKKDTTLPFRGSSNQTIIDCKNMEGVDFE